MKTSSTLVLAASASALVLLSGCGFLKSLVGKNSVDLEGADVKSMAVDIRKNEKTICPREHVQMGIFADVVLKDEKEVKKLETYTGGAGANKNDKLEFTDFAFHSEQGSFDEYGFFTPAKNVLATAGKEFEIKTVYRRRPDKFSFTTKYKPDYACIKMSGGLGVPGPSGPSGESGQGGSAGEYGGSDRAGGNGSDGGPGGPGSSGGDGGAGPHLQAFVTYVKTPFYDKLVAIRIEGELQDFVLAPIDHPVTLKATGGAGGDGGSGGRGGSGGAGGSGVVGGDGGNGGQGGQGGNGGRGGPGGTIDLVFDAKYPELARAVVLDVSGGTAGEAGSAGSGGSAGSAGSGSGQHPQAGRAGHEGARGAAGAPGQRGPDGRAMARAGSVDDKFSEAAPGAVALLDGPDFPKPSNGGGAAPAPAPVPAPSPSPKNETAAAPDAAPAAPSPAPAAAKKAEPKKASATASPSPASAADADPTLARALAATKKGKDKGK